MVRFSLTDWRETFKDREVTLSDLEKIIKPGSRVSFGSACSEPVLLTSELVKDQWKWPDLEILHFFTLSNQKFFNDHQPASFRHNTLSIIGSAEMRKAINDGKADFTPITTAETPQMLRENKIHIDVAIVQTSPPDRNGFCSLGINVDINHALVKNAKVVIAHINPLMPRTSGNSFVNFSSDIDYFIYQEYPLLEYKEVVADERTDRVADNVARLIENGSTLCLGTGKLTSALPKHLKNKSNLAIYGEMISDGIIDLIEDGIVNCSKNYYPHCMTTFLIGTRKCFDYVHDNPFIEFHPTDYISDVQNIAKNNKLCSIYGAMSVDVLGQATNHMGTKLFSGTGGEADFMRGAALSQGGKAIVALTSSTKDGKSRIVPFLEHGPIALRDIDVHYVVTEYGIAYLHGKTMRDRVLQMINVAAPEHRGWLLEEAKAMNYIFKDQTLPAAPDGAVLACPPNEWSFTTKAGKELKFRCVKPTDERLLQDLYYSLPEKDRFYRFLSNKTRTCMPKRATGSCPIRQERVCLSALSFLVTCMSRVCLSALSFLVTCMPKRAGLLGEYEGGFEISAPTGCYRGSKV
jgi:acyl-CoA hydrolase